MIWVDGAMFLSRRVWSWFRPSGQFEPRTARSRWWTSHLAALAFKLCVVGDNWLKTKWVRCKHGAGRGGVGWCGVGRDGVGI